jgi:hypothetical protein
MRRISTILFFTVVFMIGSLQTYAQCTFSTTAPAGAPGATNTFDNNAEGFTGDFAYNSQSLLTNSGSGNRTISTPIFYLAPNQNTILVRFTLDRTASHSITSYSVTATTNTTSYTLCNTTAINISPNNPTVYYLTIPRGSLPTGTNFILNIILSQSGPFRFDNFGTNVASASGSLPVNFVAFEGKKEATGIRLTWKVDVEDHARGYEVERSTDGRNYTSIGFVSAAGQSTYSFVDTKPEAISYYRVKGVDVDGKYRFSPIVSMKNGKSAVVLKAFPMPANKSITIQHSNAKAGSNISLYTESGVLVRSVKPVVNAQQTEIDLSVAKPGLYMVRFDDGQGNLETIKIIKQ